MDNPPFPPLLPLLLLLLPLLFIAFPITLPRTLPQSKPASTLGVAENYPAIRITVLNRSEGKIDEIVIRFSDHWAGKDTIHAWTYRGESEWYNYHPSTADYTKIARAITDYLENFAN